MTSEAGPFLRPRLLDIKRGRVPLDDVLAEAEGMASELEDARRHSPLLARADVKRVNAVLRCIREEAARRWATGAPGPFGRAAPPPPEPDVDEN